MLKDLNSGALGNPGEQSGRESKVVEKNNEAEIMAEKRYGS